MFRRLTTAAVAVTFTVGLAACGGSSDTSAGSSPSTSGGGATSKSAGGTIAVITVDPSNPYWKAEVDTAKSEAAKLGAEEWAKSVGEKGQYVELFGNPTDNNAQVRSDGYAEVLSQYPDLKRVQKETANWDRAEGKAKMEIMLSAHPNIVGVVAGNDEMALGAIQALKDANKLKQVKVLGFDGNQDAVNAVKSGEMVATVLQPIVEGTKAAVKQADSYLRTGKTGASTEKQAIDCILITKTNAGSLNNFVLTQ